MTAELPPERFDDIEVIIESDYDGYFGGTILDFIAKKKKHKKKFRHKKVVVSAGPYRGYDVNAKQPDDETVAVDFYSPARIFGMFRGMSAAERKEAIDWMEDIL